MTGRHSPRQIRARQRERALQHGQGALRGRRPLLIAAVIGLVVLIGSGLAWAMAIKPVRATTVASEVSSTARAAAPATAEPTGDPNTPPAPLGACVSSVEVGNQVVATADTAYDHWSRHVQAQNDYAAGKIDRAQVLATWAETKATGAEDIAAFDSAAAEFQPVSKACAGLSAADMPARWSSTATQCASRAAEIVRTVSAGGAVVTDWRHHVEMMANKPHTDSAAYGQMWRDMVAAAPPNLNAFAAARDALNQQPACTVPTG